MDLQTLSSRIGDLGTRTDNKFDKSGGLVTGGILVNPGDGQNYSANGHGWQHTANNGPTLTSASFQGLFSFTVGVGAYIIRCLIIGKGNTTGGSSVIGWGHGSSPTVGLWGSREFFCNNPSIAVVGSTVSHGASFSNDITGPAIAVGAFFSYEAVIFASYTAGGTQFISGAATSSGTWDMQSGSFIEVSPQF